LGLVGQGAAWENRLMVDVFDRERMAERAADLAVQGVFRVRSSECRVFGNYLTGERRACAGEAGLNVGESPICRIGLFTAEQNLDSVAVRRGWKPREMNRRAVTKVNHIK